MKYYKWIGWSSSVLLIVSCFTPWAYYADLNKNFTGFFSEQNIYGKPAMFFVFFAIVSIVLIYLDKVWAKKQQIPGSIFIPSRWHDQRLRGHL